MKTGTLETSTGSDVTSHDGFFGQLRIAITGGTSGLGLALVREFSARGARVAFLARHAEPVAKVERENKNTHGIVADRSEEHTSELQSRFDLVCRLLLEKKKKKKTKTN